jgi:hypothetical protein
MLARTWIKVHFVSESGHATVVDVPGATMTGSVLTVDCSDADYQA